MTEPEKTSEPPNSINIEIPIPEPDPAPSIFAGLRRLVGSSKAIVLAVALCAVAVLAYTGQIAGPVALDAILWLVGIFTGAVAAEDIAFKVRSRRAALDPKAVMSALGVLSPLLDKLLNTRAELPTGLQGVAEFEAEPSDDDIIALADQIKKRRASAQPEK